MNLRDDQLQVLWISRIDYSKNSGVKNHNHNFYQLLFIVDGEVSVIIDDKNYSINSNHCCLFKKGTVHEFYFTKESITIDIKFTINNDMVKFIENSKFPDTYKLKNMLPIKELFQLSIEAQKQKSNYFFIFQIDVNFKCVLMGIIQEYLSNYVSDLTTTSVDEKNECYTMIQFLKQHLDKEITVSDIANHFGFHPHYLIALFKKNIGMPPMHYLQLLRLDKAKRYLRFTSYSIEEIASLVGLTAPYFSRLCCKRLGMSPSKLREEMRTVIGKDIVLEKDFILDSQPPISSEF
ncbi:helix-turn-helix domain-containing protein [Clostridium tyrobutyricum]|uniref:helix-turn-helix domain-containing protein n=1 Tax=Clostridium tyrobutyricum TaxID=1519 RepID=UPI001C38CD25|nr:AraC family transcriptional regulator [Clostridium tyrobutyricum]MBV4429202.1 AraC family transcriptional regulator [Clostridium tyrobutyricum]MBV4444355.1 AraC family transcriptional regulator [Clostridium tyrobutyricum]